MTDANIEAWKERRHDYEQGLHGARGGLEAYRRRLSAYVCSLALGREFQEKWESYVKRRGMTEFIEWADNELKDEKVMV
jgi:hypothetical protein